MVEYSTEDDTFCYPSVIPWEPDVDDSDETMYECELAETNEAVQCEYEDDDWDTTIFSEVECANPYAHLLKPGQEFGSYKALCHYLGQKDKGGNSKPHQIDEFKRFFTFQRSPSSIKIIIDEVFDTPQKMPMRASNSPLKDAMKTIYWLAKNGQLQKPRTYAYLAHEIGLVTSTFIEARRNPEYLEQSLGVPAAHITAVATSVYNSLRATLVAMLKRMTEQGCITVAKDMFVSVSETSKDGEILSHVRESNAFEVLVDEICTLAALQAVECSTLAEIYRKKRFSRFTKTKEQLLRTYLQENPVDDENYQLHYNYEAFSIEATGDMDLSDFNPITVSDALRDIFFERCYKHKVANDIDVTEKVFLLNCFILRNQLCNFATFEATAFEIWGTDNPNPTVVSRVKAYCDKLKADRGK